jgi:hypothetical protein
MDTVPAGAIPADQFEAAEPQSQSLPAGVPEGAIPADQFEAAQPEGVPEGAIPAEEFEAGGHDSMGQLALTGVEGFARGLSGGLSDPAMMGARKLAEATTDNPDAWAPKPEDVTARESEHPWIAGTAQALGIGAGMLTGTGVPGLIAKGTKALLPEAVSVFGKIGSSIISNALTSGALQTTDELSKAMMGTGDPETPVSSALAHIGGAALLGGAIGGVFGALEQGTKASLAAIENAKLGDRAADLLAGMGMAAKAHAAGIPEKEAEAFINKYFEQLGATPDIYNYKTFKPGVALYYHGLQKAITKAADVTVTGAAAASGYAMAGTPGAALATGLSEKYAVPIVERVLKRPLLGVNKIILPTVMYALGKGQTSGLFDAINYATKASKGATAINKGLEAVFTGGALQGARNIEVDKQKLRDYIDAGGVDKDMDTALQAQQQGAPAPGFAEGGDVAMPQQKSGLHELYPTQTMLLNAAKGRISNYLTSIKPNSNPTKLAFDAPPDMTMAEKHYDDALTVAAEPLSVLKQIQNGTLQASTVKHLTSMYPELYSHLATNINKKVMEAQMKGEAPKYQVRQALSLFLAAPLDSTMSPSSIMSIQSVFQNKPGAPQQQQNPKSKGAPGKLGKSTPSYKTASQAGESDRSNRD